MITVEEFWRDYLVQSDNDNQELQISMFGDESTCDELVSLIASGKKSAGSSLLKDYVACGEDIPEVGRISLVVDAKGKPVCIIEVTEVIQFKFKDVTERVAKAEGEGDLSIEYWKRVHEEFFNASKDALAIENLQEEMIVTEFFKVIYSN